MISIRSEGETPPNLVDWLDLARGLAAVEVVAFHSYQLMFLEHLPSVGYGASIVYAYAAVWAMSAHGGGAVIVFFVLSGYLVGGPALIRARTGKFSATDYLTARASRLYVVLLPALVVSLCAYVVATHLAGWEAFVASGRQSIFDEAGRFSPSTSPGVAVCNALFLQTITCAPFATNLALWSLSNEFWYYVLMFALLSVRKKPLMALLILAIFALFVLAERTGSQGAHAGIKYVLYFMIWCSGVIVYVVVAPLVAWLIAFLIGFGGIYLLLVKGMIPSWLAYNFIVGLLTVAAILGLELTKITVPAFLRFTRELAKFSFSLYAIHYPILVFLNVAVNNEAPQFTFVSLGLDAAFIIVCLTIALIFYWFFERHTHAVRAWLRDLIQRFVVGSLVTGP